MPFPLFRVSITRPGKPKPQEHPSFVRLEKTVSLEKGLNEVDLHLARGSDIAILVTSNGQRVPSATVRAEGQGQNLSHPLECTTAADGTCTINGAAPGRYLVRADAAGRNRGQQTLVVTSDQRSVPVEIRLTAATTLTGRVRGTEQYPDTQLDVLVGKPGVPTITSPVGRGGEFRISEAPSGRVNLWIGERGIASALTYKSVVIPDGPEFDLTVDLPPPILLSGRVTSDGAACGGCQLTLQLLGPQIGRPLRTAEIHADGSYLVRLPAPGMYRATATDPVSGGSLVRVDQIAEDRNENFDLGGASLRVQY